MIVRVTKDCTSMFSFKRQVSNALLPFLRNKDFFITVNVVTLQLRRRCCLLALTLKYEKVIKSNGNGRIFLFFVIDDLRSTDL